MSEYSLNVSEQFYSIQGESTHAGLPCLFIRLSGCNLRCTYCDSRYTWEETGKSKSLNEILNWVDDYPGIMVELTGGEPLLQQETYPLMDALLNKGRTLLIETNGSVSIERVPKKANIILDFKCPDSGMADSNNWDNIDQLSKRSRKGCSDEVKFVLSSKEDFHWANDVINKYKLTQLATVLFSPNDQKLHPRKLAELILDYKLPVRLQLQLHRILWPEQDRGV